MTRTADLSHSLRFAKQVAPSLVVLLLAALAVFYMMNTSTRAKRVKPAKEARLVEVVSVTPSTTKLTLEAWGTVEAATQINLQSQVAGAIEWVSEKFEPGAYVEKEALLLQVEPEDYKLAVRQRRADLTRAQADLALEEGKGTVAKQEFVLLSKENSPSREQRRLMLREPQQATARATVAAAEAALAAAELDLARTHITAPFNALIMARESDLGARLTVGSDLATLVGTDRFWVVLAVPAASIRWLDLPKPGEQGAKVRLYQDRVWGRDYYREGRIIRLRGDLDTKGRMARLLIAVTDPLALNNRELQPLLMGAFVRAEITGHEIQDVLALERGWLRDDDTLWVMDRDNKLAIRRPQVIYRGINQIYVKDGVAPGEHIVTSELAVVVEGMALRLAEKSQEHNR
jgi:RND family efflux transporter MFP subunit